MLYVTFGICKDKWDATPKQKAEIKAKKDEILNALRACKTVDEMLECEIARPFISGAWLDTPDSLILRYMCNNATRKNPKNYDPMARQAQVEMDEVYQVAQAEIAENANTVEFIEDKADVVGTTTTDTAD